MGNWIRKCVRIVAGLTLAVFDVALLVSLLLECKKINWAGRMPALFLAGAVTFLVLHVLIGKRPFLYVFAHEVSHALASLVTGGKVHSIYVSGAGGATKTDRANAWVLLFPYFFPFFAVALLVLYGLLECLGEPAKFVPYFYFGTGLAMAHHLVFTATFLFRGQSDIRKTGCTILALGWIGFVNLAVLASLGAFLFEGPSVGRWFLRALFYFKELLG